MMRLHSDNVSVTEVKELAHETYYGVFGGRETRFMACRDIAVYLSKHGEMNPKIYWMRSRRGFKYDGMPLITAVDTHDGRRIYKPMGGLLFQLAVYNVVLFSILWVIIGLFMVVGGFIGQQDPAVRVVISCVTFGVVFVLAIPQMLAIYRLKFFRDTPSDFMRHTREII